MVILLSEEKRNEEKRVEEFEVRLVKALQKKLGDDIPVKPVNVLKNNGVRYRGLVIGKDRVTPTIYYDKFYKQYQWGMSIEAIVKKVEEMYRRAADNTSEMYKISKMMEDYESVREKLMIRVVNYERNQEFLNSVPHKKVQDLGLIFIVLLSEISDTIASITVNNSIMESWGISLEEMTEQALKNHIRMLPFVCRPLVDHMVALREKDLEFKGGETETGCGIICEEYDAQYLLYIVTNRINLYAAAVLAYPDILERLGEEFGGDYIIIPSSVHEILCVKDSGDKDYEELLEMLNEVNSYAVEREEVLSDSIYIYRTAEKRLLRIGKDVV